MKAVKVHIIRETDLSKPRMRYPAKYNAQEVMRYGKGPGSVQRGGGAYSKGIGKGAAEEWCFILLDDAKADEYAIDPDMEIVSGAAANADMESWRVANNETETIVLDTERVQTIYAKQAAATGMTPVEKTAAGLDLTKEEEDILDPDNDLPGMNKRLRLVADIVAESGKSLTPVAIG